MAHIGPNMGVQVCGSGLRRTSFLDLGVQGLGFDKRSGLGYIGSIIGIS